MSLTVSVKIYQMIRAMNRDSDNYKNPEEFVPERFLSSDDERKEVNPQYTRTGTHAYGFGRR